MRAVHLLTMSLSIDDVSALWAAAAAVALAAPDTTIMDVIETIGPQADPDIPDCIAMLIGAGTLAGCVIDDLSCTPAPMPDHGRAATIMAASPAHPVTALGYGGMSKLGTARSR